MKKILFSCLFFFLVGSFVILADTPPATLPPPVGNPGGVPPSPSADCCLGVEGDDPDGNSLYDDCLLHPEKYCPIPIDNSRYIYISMVAAVALASFVIARAVERKNKKTPM